MRTDKEKDEEEEEEENEEQSRKEREGKKKRERGEERNGSSGQWCIADFSTAECRVSAFQANTGSFDRL